MHTPLEATHVVVGEKKRTLKVLFGIANGIFNSGVFWFANRMAGLWIVSMDWILKSITADKWLPEEDFEVTEFPGAKKSRVAHGMLITHTPLSKCVNCS